jgi:hypothetical protein
MQNRKSLTRNDADLAAVILWAVVKVAVVLVLL